MHARMPYRKATEVFTKSLGRQILKIYERGPFLFKGGSFQNSHGDYIYMQSALALYERYLVMLVADGRYRSKQSLVLTEIGIHVARGLISGSPGAARPVSEAVSLLASELAAS